jgi:O-Antigen ligase
MAAAQSSPTRRGARPRALALLGARTALVAGPVVLAFFAGGFFDGPRDVALLAAAVTLGALAVVGAPVIPRHPAARVALLAAVAFAGWTALSATWAPVADLAGDDAERVLLYAVVLAAAAAAFADRGAARALEPLAATGTVIVVGYGLAGRLLPGLVTEHPQRSALGRLDQPLTYWNATGALAAIGLVLCTRIAGDRERPAALRCGAAAGTVPLAMGLYLSFSRGAVAALVAGLVAVMLLAPSRSQLRATLVTVVAGGAAAVAAGLADGVRALEGTLGGRERDGAIVLAVGLALMALAAVATRAGREDRAIGLPRGARWAGWAAIAALLVLPIVVAGGQQAPAATGATTERFASLGSHRFDYWRVALDAGAAHPLRGVGASGFRVEWLRDRPIDEVVRDAHSLPLETFAELGLVGVVLLAALLGGVGVAAAAAHRADPGLASGPAAALVVWALHSTIDWDWEMPAVTLVAVVLAGALAGRAPGPQRAPQLDQRDGRPGRHRPRHGHGVAPDVVADDGRGEQQRQPAHAEEQDATA